MADTITSVTNLDIQLLDEGRTDTTTIKLDNPKDNITREQVSAAFQTAFANGWFLTNKGGHATYLGDVTINKSIKTKLDGEDFYVTPNELTFSASTLSSQDQTLTITVSGATIQGYNLEESQYAPNFTKVVISDNGLIANVTLKQGEYSSSYDIQFYVALIIQGAKIRVPVKIS